jgi:hypothetical protein
MMVQTGVERSLFVTGDYNITDHQVQHRPAVQQAFDDVAGGGLSVPAGEPDSGCGHAVHRSVGRQLLQPYRSPRDQWQRYDDTTGGGLVYFYRRGWEVPRAEHDELQTYRAGGTLSGDFQLATTPGTGTSAHTSTRTI